MSFHKHGHHHHQPKPYMEEEYCCEGERIYAAPPPSSAYGRSECAHERLDSGRYERERWHGRNSNGTNFQRNERLGELGAVVAGAFALYEEHKAKIDPEHASRHHLEAGTAGLGALGSAGYAYHEHREKKKFEDGCW